MNDLRLSLLLWRNILFFIAIAVIGLYDIANNLIFQVLTVRFSFCLDIVVKIATTKHVNFC